MTDRGRIFVAGGTGYIGRHVVRELVGRGHPVTVLARERAGVGGRMDRDAVREELFGAQVAFGDVTRIEDVERAFGSEPVDAVVSCLASRTGAPEDAWAIDCEAHRQLLQVAESKGVRQFVLLSAICVQKPRLEFQKAKLAFEQELRESPIIHSIVRPTAFFKSLAGQVGRVRSGRPYLMFGDGKVTACKPISERNLASFMADCLHDPEKQDATLPVGGPGPAITPLEQGEMLFELAERPPRFRRVPVWFLGGIVRALQLGARLFPALRSKAEFARIGHYYATESMLVWDEATETYDAENTPSFGHDTLRSFYRDALAREAPAAELGDHAVFSRD